VRIQKLQHFAVAIDLVFLFHEAVAFVGEDDVLHGHVVFLDGGYDFIAFHLEHAWVIGALQYHDRILDLVGVEEGADIVEAHGIGGGGVAHFGVEGLAEALPVGWDGFEGAQPVGDAEDVHAHFEFAGGEGHRRHGHVAAVAAANDADFGGVDVFLGLEPFFAPNAVLEVLVAVVAVVHFEEGLAIAIAAAVVDGEDGIAMVDQGIGSAQSSLCVTARRGRRVPSRTQGRGCLWWP
jgi:hypothetical protein